IQGLRAWAVIAVVIFHFFPSVLPFGYLGVDVFFVLSGFIIALVLENKAILCSTYTTFYFKRIRRIFPLLLLIVLICSIYAVFCYNEMLFLYSEKSALQAALFITNLKGSNEEEDYFRDLENADDLFTHTWSLSVEIQFYLIAPLLFHMIKPSCSESFHTVGYFLALAGFSFFLFAISHYHFCLLFNTREIVAVLIRSDRIPTTECGTASTGDRIHQLDFPSHNLL
ncbi:hypothetical protein PENTCL1PPCAC_12911, partial [Pristionchus entomophagus]